MTSSGRVRRSARDVAAASTGLGLAWGAYLNVIGIAGSSALRRDDHPARPGPPSTVFRVLVPAHDEEARLATTLASLQSLDYPRDLVELHVVADNCHDRTAEIARAHGVNVHERDDPLAPGKGAALAWLIDQLPEGDDDDAFVVIDADTTVDAGMLEAFDRAFANGAEVVQGYYTVSAAASGGDIGFRAAALAVRHYARPAGRTALGGSSSLYGNAMAFREPIARAHRWSNGLTEDLEMGLRLLLEGHRVVFAPDAAVEAEMPRTLDDSVTQNERWEAGRYAVARDHLPLLLRAARDRRHGRRWAYLDAAIDISLPPLTTVLAGTATSGVALVVLTRGRGRVAALAWTTFAVGSQVAHVVHALRMAEVAPEVRRSLRRTPAHIVWKSGIFTRAIRRRPRTWIRTPREGGVAA